MCAATAPVCAWILKPTSFILRKKIISSPTKFSLPAYSSVYKQSSPNLALSAGMIDLCIKTNPSPAESTSMTWFSGNGNTDLIWYLCVPSQNRAGIGTGKVPTRSFQIKYTPETTGLAILSAVSHKVFRSSLVRTTSESMHSNQSVLASSAHLSNRSWRCRTS